MYTRTRSYNENFLQNSLFYNETDIEKLRMSPDTSRLHVSRHAVSYIGTLLGRLHPDIYVDIVNISLRLIDYRFLQALSDYVIYYSIKLENKVSMGTHTVFLHSKSLLSVCASSLGHSMFAVSIALRGVTSLFYVVYSIFVTDMHSLY